MVQSCLHQMVGLVPKHLAWIFLFLAALASIPCAGEEALLGTLDLRGVWQQMDGGGAVPDDSVEVEIPSSGVHFLGSGGGASGWSRLVELPGGWQTHLAPSGLALLVESRLGVAVELRAGGQEVPVTASEGDSQSWGSLHLFALPLDSVEAGGRLRLELL